MSDNKNLLHPVIKPGHDHEDGNACPGEDLDESKGHLIRGLVDTEGTHWLSRDDVLSFVKKEADTFQKFFGHAAMSGEMLPQYMLASSVLNGFGALLEHSTGQENVVEGTLNDDDLLRLLGAEPTPAPAPEKPTNPFDATLGSIAEALRDAVKDVEDDQQ